MLLWSNNAFVVVQSLSRVSPFGVSSCTPWTIAWQGSLFFTISQSLLKHMSIESVMPSNHLLLCRPFLLLPSIFPSTKVFSNELALHIRWPKFGASASASVLPMNNQSWFPLLLTGLISLLSKGFSSLLYSSKTSIFQCSVFFMVQLSHPYMTIRKTIALTRWTFVSKVLSPLF